MAHVSALALNREIMETTELHTDKVNDETPFGATGCYGSEEGVV